MTDKQETTADVIAAMRDEAARADMEQDYSINDAAEMMREFAWRFEEAHKREITILIDTLAEVVTSIEVRFPAIEYALDRKPYLDAKKICEQYKEEAALAAT